MLLYIIIATLLVSAISFIGLFIVSKNYKIKGLSLKWVISLAAGAMLAVTFLDLLPEAISEHPEPKNIFITVLISFLIFFVMEKIFHWHHCTCKHQDSDKKHIAYTNLIGDAIHNLTDGFLIATTFMIDTHLGIVTTLAVIVHEIPQEISDFGVLLYAGFSRARALAANFGFAMTAVLGGILFYFFGQQFQAWVPFMAAFAAGNFIYLAAADLIPELQHEDDSKKVIQHTIWLLVGVAVIFLFNRLLPGA